MRRTCIVVALLGIGCNASIGEPLGADGGATGDANVPADSVFVVDAAPVSDAAPPDAAPCTDGDANALDPDTGHCYLYFAAPLPHADAQTACLALGGHLVTSISAVENAVFAPLPGLLDAWAGGSDAAVEGTWTWVTGEVFAYTNWRSGEPNDGGTNGEDCMVIEGDNGGLWDDRPCTASYPYLCERE